MSVKLSKTIQKRLVTPVDATVPLKDRIDLKRLRAALNEPLYMDLYVADEYDYINSCAISSNPCGTVGCIAGNAILNEFPPESRKFSEIDGIRGKLSYSDIAEFILRLTENEGDELFTICFPSLKPGTEEYQQEVYAHVAKWLIANGVTEIL